MSLEKLQTMSMQNLRGVKEVHYGIVQVVNKTIQNKETAIQNEGIPTLAGSLETKKQKFVCKPETCATHKLRKILKA